MERRGKKNYFFCRGYNSLSGALKRINEKLLERITESGKWLVTKLICQISSFPLYNHQALWKQNRVKDSIYQMVKVVIQRNKYNNQFWRSILFIYESPTASNTVVLKMWSGVAGGLQDPFRMFTKSNSFHNVTKTWVAICYDGVGICTDATKAMVGKLLVPYHKSGL